MHDFQKRCSQPIWILTLTFFPTNISNSQSKFRRWTKNMTQPRRLSLQRILLLASTFSSQVSYKPSSKTFYLFGGNCLFFVISFWYRNTCGHCPLDKLIVIIFTALYFCLTQCKKCKVTNKHNNFSLMKGDIVMNRQISPTF